MPCGKRASTQKEVTPRGRFWLTANEQSSKGCKAFWRIGLREVERFGEEEAKGAERFSPKAALVRNIFMPLSPIPPQKRGARAVRQIESTKRTR